MQSPDSPSPTATDRRFNQALVLWGVFFVVNVIGNGTIPFIFGADLHAWTYSPVKSLLYSVVIYGGLFLAAPLILDKGWSVVRQPTFLLPLIMMVVALGVHAFYRPAAALVVIGLAYLHLRFNLSGLGFRSSGWRGDLIAVLLGLLLVLPRLASPAPHSLLPNQGFFAGFDRLFFNPASTAENLFYFGFLAERLSLKTSRWLTPLLIGGMYTLHEMSNPEYWYEAVSFLFIFVGIGLVTALYLWRRSTLVIWLGDGLSRFASNLI